MKKLRFFGLLVTVLLLAFGLAIGCDSTPKDETVVQPDPITYTAGNVVITFNSVDVPPARARALDTGYFYWIKRAGATLSEGKIALEGSGNIIRFIPSGGGDDFTGTLGNNGATLSIVTTIGSEPLSLQATLNGTSSGGGAGGGGGGSGGSGGTGGGTGGGGTTPADPDVIAIVALSFALPSPGVSAPTGAGVTVVVPTPSNVSVADLLWDKPLAIASGGTLGTLFAANTIYTAKAIVRTALPETFPSIVTATINGNAATVSRTSSTEITVSYTFPQTTEAVRRIALVSESMKWNYEAGDPLNFAGLAVELEYINARTETVQAASFSQKGITMIATGSGVQLNVGDTALVSFDANNIFITAGAGGFNNDVTTTNKLSVVKKVLDIKAGKATVTFGLGADGFRGLPDGMKAEIDLLKIPALFTGLPSGITAADVKYTFEPKDATGWDVSSGDGGTSKSMLTVSGAGVLYIGLEVTGGSTYAPVPKVIAPLTVNKGTITITPIRPVSKVYAAAGVSVSLTDLFTFKMKDADGTTVSPGAFSAQLVTGAFLIEGGTGVVSGGNTVGWNPAKPYIAGDLTVRRVGDFTGTLAGFPANGTSVYNFSPALPATFTVTKIPVTSIVVAPPTVVAAISPGRYNVNGTNLTLAPVTTVTGTGIGAVEWRQVINGSASSTPVPAGTTLEKNTLYEIQIPLIATDAYQGFSSTGGVGKQTVVTTSGSHVSTSPRIVFSQNNVDPAVDTVTVTTRILTGSW